jgi:hypothetical protein
VSSPFLAPGVLLWREEGMYALLTDPKAPKFIQTPISPPEVSTELRTAHLKLSPEGSLEGDVEESSTGHRAEVYREEIRPQSPDQREEWLQKRVVRMFPDAEVEEIKFENVDDASLPLVARYRLNAPAVWPIDGKAFAVPEVRDFFERVAAAQGAPVR